MHNCEVLKEEDMMNLQRHSAQLRSTQRRRYDELTIGIMHSHEATKEDMMHNAQSRSTICQKH